MLKSARLFVALMLMVNFHWTLEACVVSMNGDLPDPEPLVLLPGGPHDVFGLKPPTSLRSLVFSEGEVVRLVCTGSNFFFNLPGPRRNDIAVSCTSSGYFKEEGERSRFPFNHFNCSKVSESTTRTDLTDRCNNDQHRLIEIGFDVSPEEFYRTITVCFDDDLLNVVWSKFDLVPSIRDGEVGVIRPRFAPGPYYQNLDPDVLYIGRVSRKTISEIIGSNNTELFFPRLPPGNKVYLARGHLTANADFNYNVLKLSTYYFINVAPQWHTFNDGTWRELETSVRYYAHQRRLSLVVYTGTYGVTTLPDSLGVEQELFLDYGKQPKPSGRIPVPAVFWKVVYDRASRKGIAFVGVNNPHKEFSEVDNDPRYQLCSKKIQVSFWRICRDYHSGKQTNGFGYCCEVDDFRQTVTSLPEFKVTGVLA